MSRKPTKWIDIGAVADIPMRGARVVKSAAGCIAVFRTSEDEVFAIDDRCPHKQGPLSQGIVHDKGVTCPLHNWVISLESGEAQGADQGVVKTHAVKIEKGRLLIDGAALEARAKAA